jgi:putative oxidoreductase
VRAAREGKMKLYKLGRALFGAYFVYSGINHFLKENDLEKFAKAKNIPQLKASVIASGLALMAGGASLALGIKPKLGAFSIIGFLAAVSPAIHGFWKDRDPGERMHNVVDFTKNMALLSSALAFADARGRKR